MTKTNLQVRIPEEIDQIAATSKSEFVRESIVKKLHRERFRHLEYQRIASLKKQDGTSDSDDTWLNGEAWGEK